MPKRTGISTDNGTRIIMVQDDIIMYILKRDCTVDYFQYDETLYQILMQDRLSPYRNSDGRLRFDVSVNGGVEKFYFYELAFACYFGYVALDTFVDDMLRFRAYKKSHNLTIDHAHDNVKTNNTKYNLSLMDGHLNPKKYKIVSHFRGPYHLVIAFCGGEYRIQYTCEVSQEHIQEIINVHRQTVLPDGGAYITMRFICKNDEDCVACLKYLAHAHAEWHEHGTPQEYWKDHKNDTCWADIPGCVIAAQKQLAQMDANSFDVFTAEKYKIVEKTTC